MQFGILLFGDWVLFGIWSLVIGISQQFLPESCWVQRWFPEKHRQALRFSGAALQWCQRLSKESQGCGRFRGEQGFQ